MRLSIIVPVYNAEKFLDACLLSLMNQGLSYEDYEIIIINDGSTDKSYDIAQKYVGLYDNIRLFSQENKGQSAARNVGLDNCRGDYVAFVDSDDLIIENTFCQILSTTKMESDIITYRMKIYDKKGDVLVEKNHPSAGKIYLGEDFLMRFPNVGSCCTSLFSMRFLNKHHLRFSEGIIHEDTEFILKSYSLANKIVPTNILSYVYRYNNNSSNRNPDYCYQLKYHIDDIHLITNIQSFVRTQPLSDRLKMFLIRKNNSIVVGHLIFFMKSKDEQMKRIANEFLRIAKEKGIYPVSGRTLSVLSTAILPIINCEFIYKWLIRIK